MNHNSHAIATGSDRKGDARRPSPRYKRLGQGLNGSSKATLRVASILHIDASFKNPKEMSEEQHRPLLAGENVQHIDTLCMSHSICYMLLVAYYILYHGVCQ